MASRINRAIELLAAGPGDLLRRPPQRPRADPRPGPRGRRHLGRLHQCRDGARRLRHDRARGLHARAGRWRADPLRPPHPGDHRRSPGQRHRRANVRTNAWQFRQILGRGVHGILLCQAESAAAARAFVEFVPLPAPAGVDPPSLPRTDQAIRPPTRLGIGTPRPRLGGDRRADLGHLARGISRAAASRGRSIRTANCCSASSSRAPKASPMAEEIWPFPGSALPKWDRAISACRSAREIATRDPYPPEMEAARRQGVRRLQAQRHRVPRRLHAGKHRRQARRRRAGDLGPRSGDGPHRPRPSEAKDAGLAYACHPERRKGIFTLESALGLGSPCLVVRRGPRFAQDDS